MAKTAIINIRTEPDTKKEIEELFSMLGLTVSDAVNVFFKKALMTQAIPFEVGIPRYNKETWEAMKEAEDIKKNPQNYKMYDSFKELLADLDNNKDKQ